MLAFLLLPLVCVTAQWTQLGNTSTVQPGKLSDSSAAYSQTLDLFVMFSGLNAAGNHFQDAVSIYSFAADQWERFTNFSSAPQARGWSTLTLLQESPNRAQFILLGGYYSTPQGYVYNSNATELWTLVVERHNETAIITPTWQLLNVTSASAPGGINLHQTVNRRGKLYTFGGNRFGRMTPAFDDYNAMDEFWELTPDYADNVTTHVSWHEIPKSTVNDWPSARFGYGMSVALSATNPDEDKLILYSGRHTASKYHADVWLYHFGPGEPRWQLVNAEEGTQSPKNNNLLPRAQEAYYIASDGTVVAFGGVRSAVTTRTKTYHQTVDQVLLAKYNGANTSCASQQAIWCSVDIVSTGPSPRYNFAWAVKPQTGDLIVYGGATFMDSKEVALDGLWTLNLAEVKQLPLLLAKPPSIDNNGFADLNDTIYFMAAVLVLILSFFMCIVIMRRRRMQSYTPGPLPRPYIQPVGARAHIIAALPCKPYSEMQDLEGQHSTCAICFDTFEAATEVRVLKCEHFFHPACVDEWLAKNNNCPMCKAVVDEEAEAERFRSTHATPVVLVVAPAPSPSPDATREVEMTVVEDVPAVSNNNPDRARSSV